MKTFLPLLILLFFSTLTNGQIKGTDKTEGKGNVQEINNQSDLFYSSIPLKAQKCASDQVLQRDFKKFPTYKRSLAIANQLLNLEVKRRITLSIQRRKMADTALPIFIPVVVHIVLSDPDIITDAMVQYQIDKLNTDFSGFNADSTNLSPMYPYALRGHSKIRFILAKKDPSDNFTTGIERRCSNIVFTTEDREPVKLAADGGLNSWDPSKYINIWVANTNLDGVLGYATYPYAVAGYFPPPPQFSGIIIKQQAFGNNTSIYPFNRGRTLVHEMGHFFGLFHIFQGACLNEDFSLAGFDAGNTDDTPPQSAGTGYGVAGENSCPSGNVSAGCAGTPAGRLYQNFMDYTDDPCMSMFTANQVIRMETALDLFMPALSTSTGGKAPIVFTKDVQVLATNNPNTGNPEFMDCNSLPDKLSYCSNANPFYISPSLTIRNAGSAAINELEVWYRLGTGVAVLNKKIQFAVPLLNRQIAVLPLNPIGLPGGQFDLQLFTIKPDNINDENPFNDTIHLNITLDLPITGPITESFDSSLFPIKGWLRVNRDMDNFSWERIDLVHNNKRGVIWMNFFDYDKPGRIDDIVLPAVDIAIADSIIFSFDRAYKEFDSTVKDLSDTLEILISENCSENYKSVWKNGGSGLASVAGETGLSGWVPQQKDWKNTKIDLRPFVSKSSGAVRVIFRAKNGYGQNLFLDEISLKAIVKPIRDASIVSIKQPLERSCYRSFTPKLVIENLGQDTLRKLVVSYKIDDGLVNSINWTGNLKKFQEEEIAFNQVSVNSPGLHQVEFYINSPNDLQDQNLENDTIKWRVMIFDVVNAPIKESFEQPLFPPAGWDISASEQPFKWQRNIFASTDKLASAWVNNRSNTLNGTREELYSPVIRLGIQDSVMVTFDFSHVTKAYPGTSGNTDTLQVLLSTDCGKTFTSIYKKWGYNLNTIKEAYLGSSTRDSLGFIPYLKTQWRKDSINITHSLAGSSQFQLVFRNINYNDNNIFLDNITVNPVILPDVLKQRGYQIMPNPTTGIIYIRHYLPPVNLEGIQVVNANGQTLLFRRYKGNALATIPVDLSNQEPGVYILRLMYRDKNITEKIFKIK